MTQGEIALPSQLAQPRAINYGQLPHVSAQGGATDFCAFLVKRTVK